MMTKMESATDATDTNLVSQSLSGNREAFGQIVARYQTLICSLAYSGTGSLSQSEDLAQETFLVAFRQLANLREPQKLRSWLCGIARNLIHDALKKQGREPTYAAQPLDALHDSPASEPHPREAAITREEQAILWQAIERIPGLYREPLILFYREHQSIETVARLLDSSEDAIKQRLSRGRKLLQEQVMAFVEGALEQTSPGTAFTLSLLAMLPAATTTAKAATLGAAGKGVAVAKGMTLGSGLALLTGPMLGALIGRFSYKILRKFARTPREHAFVKRNSILFLIFFCVSFPIYLVFINFIPKLWLYLPFVTPIAFCWIIFAFAGMEWFDRKFTMIRGEERKLHPELFSRETLPPVLEYRSRTIFLGLPLVHIRYRRRWGMEKKPAVGWIAFGEIAYGLLFACGRFAVGGISLGAMSFGIVSLGALSFGLIAAGAFALGAFASGYMVIGWAGSGWWVLGFHGFAGDNFYTVGGIPPSYFEHYARLFLLHARTWPSYVFWLLVIVIVPALLSLFLLILTKAWLLRKALKQEKS